MIYYFLVRGLPGVGKSTLAASYQKLKIIDPDFIQLAENLPSESVNNAHTRYRKNVSDAISLLSANQSFIWTQPWSKRWGLELTIENISKLSIVEAKPVLINILAPSLTCYTRYKNRESSRHVLSSTEYRKKYTDNFDNVENLDLIQTTILNVNLEDAKVQFSKFISNYL